MQLGPRNCSKLVSLHMLSCCDTVSYPFRKGKKSTHKLVEIIYQVLIKCSDNLARPTLGARRQLLLTPLQTEELYGNECHSCSLLPRPKKPTPLTKFPQTDVNPQLHVLRAHLQMLLSNAADQWYMLFWYMGSLDKYAAIADRFDMAESTIVAPSGTCCDSLPITYC